MAVVKWGNCGSLDERSLCDSFGVTVAPAEAEDEDEDEAPNVVGSAAVALPEEVAAGAGAAEVDTNEGGREYGPGRYDAMMLDGYVYHV